MDARRYSERMTDKPKQHQTHTARQRAGCVDTCNLI